MADLTRRFPRASLIAQAGGFETRLQALLDETHLRMMESEDYGMHVALGKFKERFAILEAARQKVNEVRLILWQLE